jgi:hypothetical protein
VEGQRATSTEQTEREFARVVAWAELCGEGLQPDDVANRKSIHAEMGSRGALLTGLSLSFLEAQSVKTSIEGLWWKNVDPVKTNLPAESAPASSCVYMISKARSCANAGMNPTIICGETWL